MDWAPRFILKLQKEELLSNDLMHTAWNCPLLWRRKLLIFIDFQHATVCSSLVAFFPRDLRVCFILFFVLLFAVFKCVLHSSGFSSPIVFVLKSQHNGNVKGDKRTWSFTLPLKNSRNTWNGWIEMINLNRIDFTTLSAVLCLPLLRSLLRHVI